MHACIVYVLIHIYIYDNAMQYDTATSTSIQCSVIGAWYFWCLVFGTSISAGTVRYAVLCYTMLCHCRLYQCTLL